MEMKEREQNKERDTDKDRDTGKGSTNKDRVLDWDKYIRGELDELQIRHAESLLLHDTDALDAYMTALSCLGAELPRLQQEDAFIEAIMLKLPEQNGERRKNERVKPSTRKRRIREHPLFNYVIAASITLFLLSFGVFDRMTSGAQHVIPPSSEQPFSEQIMDKTSDWIDQLKP